MAKAELRISQSFHNNGGLDVAVNSMEDCGKTIWWLDIKARGVGLYSGPYISIHLNDPTPHDIAAWKALSAALAAQDVPVEEDV